MQKCVEVISIVFSRLGRLSVVLSIAVALAPGLAAAQNVSDLTVFGEARLRYEGVFDDRFEVDAAALTLRLRSGLEKNLSSKFRVLAEGEAILPIVDNFNDAAGGISSDELGRPFVPDAGVVELNRFLIAYEPSEQLLVVGGRHRISLDDERFIGRIAFRQNEQTFDGARVSGLLADRVSIELGYFGRVNRIFGRNSEQGRFEGASYYVNASVDTAVGQITAFQYALDLETPDIEAGGPIVIASSRTYGARLSGRRYWERADVGVDWAASYSEQESFAGAPSQFSHDYLQGEAGVSIGRFGASAKYERLAGDGQSAFQTPLGTNHKFQGRADVFLITPDDGIEEISVIGRIKIGQVGPFRGVRGYVEGFIFNDSAGGVRYGEELDIGLFAKVASLGVSVEYGGYRARNFAKDSERVYVTLQKRF